MITLGIPYLENVFSLRNLTRTLALVVLVGTATTHLVYSKENIFISKRTWKWSHRINPLNIENLNNND